MPSIRISKEQNEETYFMTFTVIGWVDIFTSDTYNDLIIDCLKFYQCKLQLQIYGYVIMTNHIHIIVSATNIIKFVQGFKSYTTRLIICNLQEDNRKYIKTILNPVRRDIYPIWQPTNMSKIIETDKYFLQKLEYIHNNPVEKGLVDTAENWLYSSARNYILDDNSIINVVTDEL